MLINKNIKSLYWPAIFFIFVICIWPIAIRPLTNDESHPFLESWLLKNSFTFFDNHWSGDKPLGTTLIYYLFSLSSDNITNLFLIRIGSALYQFATVVAFYFLAKRISGTGFARKLLPIFVLVYSNPFIEGQLANSDNFTALPIILSYLFFFRSNIYWPAFIMGLSFIIKQNTALLMVPISISILLTHKFNLKSLRIVLLQFGIFVFPTLLILLYATTKNTHWNYLNLVFLDRIRSHITFKNYLFFWRYVPPIVSQAAPLVLGFLLFLVLTMSKRILGGHVTLIRNCLLMWGLFGLISVWVGGYFFPHYFLELAPIIVLGSGLYFNSHPAECLFAIVISLIGTTGVWGGFLTNTSNVVLAVIVFFVGIYSTHLITKNRLAPIIRRQSFIFLLLPLSLLLTLKHSPINQLQGIDKFRIQNPLSKNEKDVLQTAHFLRENRPESRETLIIDYSPDLYILSNILPPTPYTRTYQLIDFTEVITDNLNYSPSDDYAQRQREIIENFRSKNYKRVIINFNLLTEPMIVKMDFLFKEIKNFKPIKVFGGIWIYQLTEDQSAQIWLDQQKSDENGISISEDSIDFQLKWASSSVSPPIALQIKCSEDISWRYPENGKDFPLRADFAVGIVKLYVAKRGLASLRGCVINLHEISIDEKTKITVSQKLI